MSAVRRPAVAGHFYPAEPKRLAAVIERLLEAATPPGGVAPRAMIQPHAGYEYSGPVAASGYRRLRDTGSRPRRVVILGPAHTVPLEGMALDDADVWDTPLGQIPIDTDLRGEVVELGAAVDAGPHAREHAIEVHLPFLQIVLGTGWSLLPVVVGRTPATATATLVDRCLDRDALVIVSTDLSHYLTQAEATARDATTIAAIRARNHEAIGPRDACGCHPLRGLLASERLAGDTIEVLDVRTSWDTAGGPDRVVGYSSIVLTGREAGSARAA